jgi:SsrA-binding protein
MVPLRIYWSKNRAKLEIGLAKGKRQYDKREAIAARDARREMDRARKTRV